MRAHASTVARNLKNLYIPERGGTVFAIDGLLEPDVLERWLKAGILGQTSNQSLFLAKVKAGQLDTDIARLHRQGKTPAEIFNILYNREAETSAQVLSRWVRPEDSLAFSRETDATRAADKEAIVAEAQTIQAISPWVFVKLANVGISETAIREMIRDAMVRGARTPGGTKKPVIVNPNITLVFGPQHYLNTVRGYIEGLEALAAAGADIASVNSVNSLFVSRTDTTIDKMIDDRLARTPASEQEMLRMLRGKTAVALAKKIYQMSRAVFLGEAFQDSCNLFSELHALIAELAGRFRQLRAKCPGVRMQRVLIASSSNKQTGVYSELIYVLPFLGEQIGNTLPLKTLEYLNDYLMKQGIPIRDTVLDPLPWMPQDATTIAEWEQAVMAGGGSIARTADEVLWLIRKHVLDPGKTTLTSITDDLRDKGAAAFAADQQKAYEVFGEKVNALFKS